MFNEGNTPKSEQCVILSCLPLLTAGAFTNQFALRREREREECVAGGFGRVGFRRGMRFAIDITQ